MFDAAQFSEKGYALQFCAEKRLRIVARVADRRRRYCALPPLLIKRTCAPVHPPNDLQREDAMRDGCEMA
jgi:hypothetical protein